MANHLEDLTAEWLEYNGYFVRKSVLVGKLSRGGFEGELDVIGFNPLTHHVIHVECSLDAHSWPKREERFAAKFERGRKYILAAIPGLRENLELDQVALMQLGGGTRTHLGSGRLIWVADFVADILDCLARVSPDKQAVPSTLPLLRTMQLAAQPSKSRKSPGQLLPPRLDMIS